MSSLQRSRKSYNPEAKFSYRGKDLKKRYIVEPEEQVASESESSSSEESKLFSSPRKEKSRADFASEQTDTVTPPKQKKFQDTESSTPICQHVEATTPSSLLSNLSLALPSNKTGRLSRKTLFAENNERENTKDFSEAICRSRKLSNKTDVMEEHENVEQLSTMAYRQNNVKNLNESHQKMGLRKSTSIYQEARLALHGMLPLEMPGREKELEDIRNFLLKHSEHMSSGSMYVSGPPGTGKTAAVSVVLEEERIASQFKYAYVNCTAIKSPAAIYSRITKELGIKSKGRTETGYMSDIENYLKKSLKMTLLILDEIDQLENKNQSVLYSIFEWPSKPKCRLVLIGIANALDLTDRVLPRLQARCELKPKLLHFAPYTKQQIVEIFSSRLRAAGVLEVFSPVALHMLAGKVAAISGDVRRALDIGRRVIELVDHSKKGNTLKCIENITDALVEQATKTVELKEVMSILNNIYGTSQTLTEESDDSMPLQQKIVTCSLLLMLKKGSNKNITVGKLHEVYRRVCVKRNIQAVDQSEFIGLCSLIETRGIIRVSGKKEPRLCKINLEWDEEEVSVALQDKQLISMIIQDTSCLEKI